MRFCKKRTVKIHKKIEVGPNHSKYKLDMGKSCIRFKRLDDIPFELIGKLCSKMTVKEWITVYEKEIKT